MNERRTINITEKTYSEFKKLGVYGEKAEDILIRLMKQDKVKGSITKTEKQIEGKI